MKNEKMERIKISVHYFEINKLYKKRVNEVRFIFMSLKKFTILKIAPFLNLYLTRDLVSCTHALITYYYIIHITL